jgi:hypothetical protein
MPVRVPWRSCVVAIALAVLCVGAQSAAASDTYTWTGSSSAAWSNPDNWQGGAAPSGSVSTLDFPDVSASGELDTTNDVAGISVNAIDVTDATAAAHDQTGIELAGDRLILGAGGLQATTSSSTDAPAIISLPITMDAAQTWSIDGGPYGTGEVGLDYLVGDYPLTVDFADGGTLDLEPAFDSDDGSDVGEVTITGADSSQTGLNAAANGTVATGQASQLNGSGALQITDAALDGDLQIGMSVNSTGGLLYPDPGFSVAGSVSLDAASAAEFAISNGDGAPASSRIYAQGNVNLGGSTLALVSDETANDCPILPDGTVLTLVSSATAVTGTFANVPNGTDVTMSCGVRSQPVLQINYTATSVTATVVYGGSAATYTTLTADPTSAKPNEPVTLTATVTADSGTPNGSVYFEESPQDGPTYLDCSEQSSVVDGSTLIWTCVTSFPNAWWYTLDAYFSPGDTSNLDSSEGPLNLDDGAAPLPPSPSSIILSPSPRPTPALAAPTSTQALSAGTIALEKTRVHGDSVTVVVKCVGATEAQCPAIARLKLHGAAVATHEFQIASPETSTVKLSLDAKEQRQLRLHHRLVATLVVENTLHDANAPSQKLTFVAPH